MTLKEEPALSSLSAASEEAAAEEEASAEPEAPAEVGLADEEEPAEPEAAAEPEAEAEPEAAAEPEADEEPEAAAEEPEAAAEPDAEGASELVELLLPLPLSPPAVISKKGEYCWPWSVVTWTASMIHNKLINPSCSYTIQWLSYYLQSLLGLVSL